MFHSKHRSVKAPSRPNAPEHPITSSPSSPGLRERQTSFAQPTFEDKPISIRRISFNPSEPDVVQRMNCITSTLNAANDPTSDMLPYGGRKSSIASMSFCAPMRTVPDGVVDVGERRPSVLSMQTGVEEGLRVRRVGAGGGEDILRVRSASIPAAVVSTGPGTHYDTLSIPPQTPPSRDSDNTPLPLALAMPISPHASCTSEKRVQNHLEGSPDQSETEELESLPPVTTESLGEVFHAWHGFPPKDTPMLPNVPVQQAAINSGGRSDNEDRRDSSSSRTGKVIYLAEIVEIESGKVGDSAIGDP